MSSLVRAVIFDLDGVLLDTEPLYTEAAQAVLTPLGKTYDFELKRRIMGGSAMAGAAVVVQALGLAMSPAEYLEQRKATLERLLPTARAVPGAPQLVETLAQRRIPMAVATSSERRLFLRKTERHPFFSLFDRIICGDDPRVKRAKPAPDIFLLAASELGYLPEDCLVFEDAPNGVQAARAAGMRVIARVEPPMEPADLAAANLTISRYDELDIAALLGGGGV